MKEVKIEEEGDTSAVIGMFGNGEDAGDYYPKRTPEITRRAGYIENLLKHLQFSSSACTEFSITINLVMSLASMAHPLFVKLKIVNHVS